MFWPLDRGSKDCLNRSVEAKHCLLPLTHLTAHNASSKRRLRIGPFHTHHKTLPYQKMGFEKEVLQEGTGPAPTKGS